mmetsp:Transcript_20097/g.58774  ORF Transcript_20097/g.58774 Transcript_20097/m.58774 type:complete len:317 (-) Transcript_20097:112-1062(-)
MPNSNEKGALPSLSSSSASPCPTFSRIRKVCICAGEDHDIVFFKAGDLDFFHKPVPRREDFLAEGCLVRTQMSKDPLLCVRLDSCRISVKVHNHKPPRVWSEVSAYVFTCRSRILQMVVDIAHDRHVDGTLQRRPLAKLVTMKGVSSVSCDDFNILQLLVLNASPHPRSEIRRKLACHHFPLRDQVAEWCEHESSPSANVSNNGRVAQGRVVSEHLHDAVQILCNVTELHVLEFSFLSSKLGKDGFCCRFFVRNEVRIEPFRVCLSIKAHKCLLLLLLCCCCCYCCTQSHATELFHLSLRRRRRGSLSCALPLLLL